MAYPVALRPFGFSQPTRITIKSERRAGTPIPSDDSLRASNTYRTPRSHRSSLSEDCSPSYWSPPPHSRAPAYRAGHSHMGTFPDEEEDDDDDDNDTVAAMPPTRYTATARQKRRPARLQSSRHAAQQHPSPVSSPITPTAIHQLSNLHLHIPSSSSSPPSSHREDFSQKQLQEQLKEVYSALRRVEDERETVLSQMKRGRVDQCRVERELQETRRENQRLAARLEEMLKSPKLKSPLSPRSDDGWGCSMYEMEAFEGH